MNYSPGTTISKVAFLLNKLDQKGIDTNQFLLDLNIEPSLFESPDNSISLKELQAIMIRAAELTGDYHFGLNHGCDVGFFPNILAHILVNCPSIGVAITKFMHYHSLTDPGNSLKLSETNGKSMLIYSACDDELDQDRHLTAYRIASMKHYIDFLSVEKVSVCEVLIRHEPPENHKHYNTIFGAPVSFKSKCNALIYASGISKIAVRAPNSELLSFFEEHAKKMLTELHDVTPYSLKVAGRITDSLSGGVPPISHLASELGVSVRKLQQNLKNEGTSYTGIIEKIRKKLAESYLKENNIPFSEISYLIGFSEPSVFFRTFKKWNGMTPGEYRIKIRKG